MFPICLHIPKIIFLKLKVSQTVMFVLCLTPNLGISFFFFLPDAHNGDTKGLQTWNTCLFICCLNAFGFKQCQECAKLTMQPPIAPFISQKNAVVTFPEKAISFG